MRAGQTDSETDRRTDRKLKCTVKGKLELLNIVDV